MYQYETVVLYQMLQMTTTQFLSEFIIHCTSFLSLWHSWQMFYLHFIISAKCEHSEHWKRLWDQSFCSYMCVRLSCVCLFVNGAR